MTSTETQKLLNIISATYPSFLPNPESVGAWQDAFIDRSFGDVRGAFVLFVKRNKKAFAPSPGELLALLPAGKEETEETVEHFDGGYSITRVWTKGEKATRRTFQTATRAEKAKYQAEMEARGYVRCVEKRPRGYAVYYRPAGQA